MGSLLLDTRSMHRRLARNVRMIVCLVIAIANFSSATRQPPILHVTPKSAQMLNRECAKFEQDVLINMSTAPGLAGERIIVQADNLRLVYNGLLTRSGQLCLTQQIGMTKVEFPKEDCSSGDIDEKDDEMPHAPQPAEVYRVMYIGYGAFVFIFQTVAPVESVKYAFRFRVPAEFHQNPSIGISPAEYLTRVCNILKNPIVTGMLQKGIFRMLQLEYASYNKAKDAVVLIGLTIHPDKTDWDIASMVYLTMNGYKSNSSMSFSNRGEDKRWLAGKEGIVFKVQDVTRTKPHTLTYVRKPTEVIPYLGQYKIKYGLRMSAQQLLGCPMQLCWRTDLDAVLVDDFNVIRATNDRAYRYDLKTVSPTTYFFGGSFVTSSEKVQFEKDGKMKSIDMVTNPVLFDSQQLIKNMLPLWKAQPVFPVQCQIDGTFMQAAGNRDEMMNKQDLRVAWAVLKDGYVYIAYFKFDLVSAEFSSLAETLSFQLTKSEDIFPKSPKYVEGALAVHNLVILVHQRQLFMYRFFMKSLTAMQIPEVVVFNQAPADWTGVLGYRSSAYFFSYHKYSQYLVSPKAAVEVVRTLASSRELFKNCTYMTMMEENDFGRWGGYSPEESAQLSVAKGGDVSNAAWAESDDAYEENFAFATLKATTATVTAMTEAIFTPAVMAIESTEVNYPVLLGASMAVLFVFLILLILMEMLRRKNRRRRRRSGGGSRLSATSSMASRSNVASKSAIGSRSNISSTGSRSRASNVDSKASSASNMDSKAGSRAGSKLSRPPRR